MKKAENFRLGDVTRAKLSRLADLWGCSKTSVVDQLIMDCLEGPAEYQELVPSDTITQNVELETVPPRVKMIAPEFKNPVPDPKDPLGMLTDEQRATVLEPDPSEMGIEDYLTKPLTQEERRERMQNFSLPKGKRS